MYRLTSTTSRNCLFLLVMYHGFKKILLERGFHILITNASFLSPIDVRSHNPPPLELVSSLAHCLLSNSYTICNRLDSYYSLWPVTYSCQPHDFKTHSLGRGFHTLITNASFLPPTDVGSHNLPPLGLASSLTYRPSSDIICNSPDSLLVDIIRFSSLRIAVSLTVLKHAC